MVRAWIADVTPLLDKGCYDSYYRQAPDFRKKKADALRLDKMKAQSIGVWALWQKIRTAYELPEEPVFNFSHSGTCVMCAVCMDGRSVEGRKVRVGCDVEKTGQLKMNIAMRYFCKEITAGQLQIILIEMNHNLLRSKNCIHSGGLAMRKNSQFNKKRGRFPNRQAHYPK